MITKEALAAPRLEEDTVTLPVGAVRVRALSRAEALRLKGRDYAEDEFERVLLAAAMVEPKLTEDDVRAWQEASPAGELEPVTTAVLRLSGMAKAAAKEAMTSFRD